MILKEYFKWDKRVKIDLKRLCYLGTWFKKKLLSILTKYNSFIGRKNSSKRKDSVLFNKADCNKLNNVIKKAEKHISKNNYQV